VFASFAVVRRGAAVSSAVVVLVCSCGGNGKAREPEVVLARNTTSGKGATATASLDAQGRADFSARVTATPSQRVSGGWVVSCVDFHITTRDAENFSGRTPLTLRLRPIPKGSGECTVVVTATLARSGRVTVKLLGAR
jgi:hypothetical protein